MIIRFNPQVPSAQQPVQPSGKGFALSTIGKAITQVGGQLGQIAISELKEQRAAEKTTAHASALQNVNAFALLYQDRSAELQTTLITEGREEEYLTLQTELFDEMSDIFREQYTGLDFNDPPFYDTLVENKFSPIKESQHVTSRKMVANKSLRTYAETIETFQVEAVDISIEEVDHRFGLIDAIGNDMEDNQVFNQIEGDKDKLLMGALTGVMKARAARNTENLGEAAAAINAAEFKFISSRLLPLYNVELARFARGEREAGHKLTTEQERVKTRQIVDRIAMGAFDNEAQVLLETQEAGLPLLPMQRIYTEHVLRKQARLDQMRTTGERLFKKNSEILTLDAMMQTARSDSGFDAVEYVKSNKRVLTPSDSEKLLKYAAVYDKKRDSTTDLSVFQEFVQRADEDAFGPGDTFDQDVLEKRALGELSIADTESLVTRRANNKKTIEGKEKIEAIFREGHVGLDRIMRRTSPILVDPVAIAVRDRFRSKLNGAMWSPEQNKQDFTDFHEAPLKFVNRLKAEGSAAIDQALVNAALQSIDMLDPRLAGNLITFEGRVNVRLIAQSLKDKTILPLEAERLVLMNNMILRGAYRLPDGRIPKPPKLPKVEPKEPQSLLEKLGDQLKDIFTFGEEGEEAPTPRRKPTKKKAFEQ